MSALGAKTGELTLAGSAPGSLASSAAGACKTMPHQSANFAGTMRTFIGKSLLRTGCHPRHPEFWPCHCMHMPFTCHEPPKIATPVHQVGSASPVGSAIRHVT